MRQIKELMAAMGKAGIKRLSLKNQEGFEIELEAHPEDGAHPYPHTYPYHHPPAFHPDTHLPTGQPPTENATPADNKPAIECVDGDYITSPMVGTFYTASSPDDPPFIKVGDLVEEGTVICIIEAMKVMNEVKAGRKGVVAEILLENGHPLEFGTKMFRIG